MSAKSCCSILLNVAIIYSICISGKEVLKKLSGTSTGTWLGFLHSPRTASLVLVCILVTSKYFGVLRKMLIILLFGNFNSHVEQEVILGVRLLTSAAALATVLVATVCTTVALSYICMNTSVMFDGFGEKTTVNSD
jgi:hypothetical protein